MSINRGLRNLLVSLVILEVLLLALSAGLDYFNQKDLKQELEVASGSFITTLDSLNQVGDTLVLKEVCKKVKKSGGFPDNAYAAAILVELYLKNLDTLSAVNGLQEIQKDFSMAKKYSTDKNSIATSILNLKLELNSYRPLPETIKTNAWPWVMSMMNPIKQLLIFSTALLLSLLEAYLYKKEKIEKESAS